MPVLYNKVKSLTIRVSKFLGFSNFLICIYCFYYLFLNRDISFRHKYDCPRRAAILSLHVGQAYCPGTRWASRMQGQRVLTCYPRLLDFQNVPTSRRSACPFCVSDLNILTKRTYVLSEQLVWA